MNAKGTEITGMVAVCNTKRANVRFGYKIDLATDKVIYNVSYRSKCAELVHSGFVYAKARAEFDLWCAWATEAESEVA